MDLKTSHRRPKASVIAMVTVHAGVSSRSETVNMLRPPLPLGVSIHIGRERSCNEIERWNVSPTLARRLWPRIHSRDRSCHRTRGAVPTPPSHHSCYPLRFLSVGVRSAAAEASGTQWHGGDAFGLG